MNRSIMFFIRSVPAVLHRGVLLSVCAAAVLLSCAAPSVEDAPIPSGGYYETCFYFLKLPENIGYSHLITASRAFRNHMNSGRKKSITAMKFHGGRSCYFSSEPLETGGVVFSHTDKKIEYLLNAFFRKENASVYHSGTDGIRRISDAVPTKLKVPVVSEKPSGDSVIVSGNNRRVVDFKNYVAALKMPHTLGVTADYRLTLIIDQTDDERFLLLPFLWEKFNFHEIVPTVPGDLSIIPRNGDSSVRFSMYYNGWKKRTARTRSGSADRIVIDRSVLNSPFDASQIAAWLFSLKNSFRNAYTIARLYSPVYSGGTIRPGVKLFSCEIAVDNPVVTTPEDTFLWIMSGDGQFDFNDDVFFANLLSLKLARRLYTGIPSFLGGQHLFRRTMNIPFETIRQMFFTAGTVTYHGSFLPRQYLYDPSEFSESDTVNAPGEIDGVKAFFGAPEAAQYLIVSFVVRDRRAGTLIRAVRKKLYKAGFTVVQELSEDTGTRDAWAAVSIRAPLDMEKRIVSLFETDIAPKHKTFSLGVYRVIQ